MSRARLVPALAAVLLAALVTGCGDEVRARLDSEPVDPTRPHRRRNDPTEVPAAPGEVTTGYAATVLDAGHGAELCLGGVIDVDIRRSAGVRRLVGWDWADHAGDFEEASGVRWGEFVVTGTFDGTSFTPSEVVPADEFDEPRRGTAHERVRGRVRDPVPGARRWLEAGRPGADDDRRLPGRPA